MTKMKPRPTEFSPDEIDSAMDRIEAYLDELELAQSLGLPPPPQDDQHIEDWKLLEQWISTSRFFNA